MCSAGKAEKASTSKAGFCSIDAAMAELDMEHYDSDDAETSGQVSCSWPVPICLALPPTSHKLQSRKRQPLVLLSVS